MLYFGLLLLVTLLVLNVFVISNFSISQFAKKEQTLKLVGKTAANIAGENFDDKLNLNEKVRAFAKESEGRVLITDLEANILVDEETTLFGKRLERELVKSALEKKTDVVIQYSTSAKKKMVNIITPIVKTNSVLGTSIIAADVSDVQGDVREFENFVLGISIISLMGAMLIAFFIGERISKPVKNLHQAVREMYTGNYKVNVEIEGSDEVAELGVAFNDMSQRIYLVNEKKDSFISDVSHELKTPLTSVKAMIEGLLYVKKEDISFYKEYLTDVNGEIDRLSVLVSKLLHDSKIAEMSIVAEEIVVFNEVEAVARHMSHEILEKGIRIEYESLKGVKILADRPLFQELLINLIHNGIKYGKPDGKFSIEYTFKPQKILSFSDDGIGIAATDLPYIFDLFYRSDDSRSRTTGGSGIGLNIVKRIVTAHKWDMKVTSVMDKGTTFHILLEEV